MIVVLSPLGMALAPIGPIAVMAPVWGFIENRVSTEKEPVGAMPYSPVVVGPNGLRLGVPVPPPMKVRFALAGLTEYSSPFCSVYRTPLATARPSYPPDPI